MPVLRKIFFYIFALVYCLLCPLLVIYALGYILRPGGEEGIIKTGLISLSTTPPGATVYMGKKRYTEKTPAILRGLLPGDYDITVSLKNYRPWSRTVSVEAEKASVFEKILLLPKEWRYERLAEAGFGNLIPLPGSHFFIAVRGSNLGGVFIYDWKNKKIHPVFQRDFPFRNARVLDYFTADKGGFFLLHAQMGLWGEEKFLWVEPAAPALKVRDVTYFFRERPQNVSWSIHEPRTLFLFRDGVLNKLDVTSGAFYPKFMEKIIGVGVADGKVYTINEEGVLRRMGIEGEGAESLDQEPVLADLLRSAKDFFRVKVLPDGKTLFWGRRGELLGDRVPYWLVDKGVTGIEPNPRAKKILLWRNDRLGILDLAGVEWIFKRGKRISQAFWVHEGSHVLFRDDGRLTLIELGNGAGPVFHDLFEVRRGSSIVYEEGSGALYYLEKTTGHLCVTMLLPRKEASGEI